MEEFKPNFADKIESEYRGLTVPSTSLAFSDNQDSEAGKNDDFFVCIVLPKKGTSQQIPWWKSSSLHV